MAMSQEEQIRQLIDNYKDMKLSNEKLRKENTLLKAENANKDAELQIRQSKIAELEKNFTLLKTARALTSSEEERQIAKKQIKTAIKKIDDCLRHLNLE